jgi:hypothetical protein
MCYSGRVFIPIFSLISLFGKGFLNYSLSRKSNTNKNQKKRTKEVGSKKV